MRKARSCLRGEKNEINMRREYEAADEPRMAAEHATQMAADK